MEKTRRLVNFIEYSNSMLCLPSTPPHLIIFVLVRFNAAAILNRRVGNSATLLYRHSFRSRKLFTMLSVYKKFLVNSKRMK